MNDAVASRGMQASPALARELEAELERFLAPLIAWLDTLLDKCLVRTLVASIVALVEWRNRAHGLLLSELGAYICTPAHAPAGTKRLSNLLRSPRWEANLLNLYLWRQATHRLAALETAGETPLLIWDTSVLEKPESSASPDLGSVRSSKAQRLTHIKPGFYHPPTRPLFVPGWRWIGLLLVGLSGASGPPCVADMRWWTTRGPHASDQDREHRDFLQVCAQSWHRRVLHVWDRGYARRAWVDLALAFPVRFVVRWPNRDSPAQCPHRRVSRSRLAGRAGTTCMGVPSALGCAAARRAPHERPGYSCLAARRLPACTAAVVAGRRATRPGPGTLVSADH